MQNIPSRETLNGVMLKKIDWFVDEDCEKASFESISYIGGFFDYKFTVIVDVFEEPKFRKDIIRDKFSQIISNSDEIVSFKDICDVFPNRNVYLRPYYHIFNNFINSETLPFVCESVFESAKLRSIFHKTNE
jgi:hypothetical protein